MVTRQKQTTQADQQVRIYKFIALAFLAITLLLFGVIVFMSSKRSEIVIITKPKAVSITTTLAVNGKDNVPNSITGNVVTMSVDGSRNYSPTGYKEEPSIATGVVILHNETSVDQPLVATTRVLSDSGVLFRLKDRILVPAFGTVEASVYADEKGASSNIEPSRFTIPGLNQAKQKVIYAVSESAMTGGIKKIGTVSQEDIDKATKFILADLEEDARLKLNKSSGGNVGVFDVTSSSISIKTSVGEEVSEFTVLGSATVVGIFFSQEDVARFASSALMSHAIDDAEYIEPSDVPPIVTLVEYDISSGIAILDVTYSGRATINPESKQLSKMMFFGKTKDEVRRYLLSLDHIYGVDVTLRPVWTKTIPHVAEHIDIVVKQVE